eukprot:Nk52_evm37s2367 gene=Nk52_evmTU37s2367
MGSCQIPRVAGLSRRGALTKQDLKKEKLPIEARITGPGPAAYNLPNTVGIIHHDFSRRVSPAHSFGLKNIEKANCVSPGPAAYRPRHSRTGHERSEGYSIGGRTTLTTSKDLVCSPGPAQYHISIGSSMKRKTMGIKLKDWKTAEGPGPGHYTVPETIGGKSRVYNSSANYSISGPRTLEKSTTTPGPNNYAVVDIDITSKKKRYPKYSLTGRPRTAKDTESVPGPGAYDQKYERILPHTPAFTMRQKHSEFLHETVEGFETALPELV